MGRPYQVISEIANAKKAITPDTAIQLGTVLGHDPQYWLNLENTYQLVLARQRERQNSRNNEAWLSAYPIDAMTHRGWLDPTLDTEGKAASLLDFLGVFDADPARCIESAGVKLPTSELEADTIGSLYAWLRKGEIEAEVAEVADFNAKVFEQAMGEIRLMMEYPPAALLPMLEQVCANSGVVFRLIESFPNAPIKGAARWLNKQRALIQLGADEQTADSFWLSFYHLAGHLLRHQGDRKVHLDGFDIDFEPPAVEQEADSFAWANIIPEERWRSFCAQGRFMSDDIWEFALSIDTPPFMVVSRLEWEQLISGYYHPGLNHFYSWSSSCETLQIEHSFAISDRAHAGNWVGTIKDLADVDALGASA